MVSGVEEVWGQLEADEEVGDVGRSMKRSWRCRSD
jgi:hypothetical protein